MSITKKNISNDSLTMSNYSYLTVPKIFVHLNTCHANSSNALVGPRQFRLRRATIIRKITSSMDQKLTSKTYHVSARAPFQDRPFRSRVSRLHSHGPGTVSAEPSHCPGLPEGLLLLRPVKAVYQLILAGR